MLSAKKFIYSFLSLILGLFLVWLVIKRTPVNLEIVIQHLNNLNYIYVGAILVTSLINVWITAYKWKLTTELIVGKNGKKQDFYLTYIILGSLLGQFMPQQMSMMTIQSFAMKAHSLSTVSKSLFTIIYDQVFNVLIPALLFFPALLLIFHKISVSQAIFLSCFVLLSFYLLIHKYYKKIITYGVRFYYQIKNNTSKDNFSISQHTIKQLTVKKKFISVCFVLATLRYFNLVLRWIFVVLAGSLNIKLFTIIFATPIIYIAMLLSITPANLGIVEWSWLGVLELFQVAEVEAVTFALLQRILFFFSIITISICLFLFHLKQYYLSYKSN